MTIFIHTQRYIDTVTLRALKRNDLTLYHQWSHHWLLMFVEFIHVKVCKRDYSHISCADFMFVYKLKHWTWYHAYTVLVGTPCTPCVDGCLSTNCCRLTKRTKSVYFKRKFTIYEIVARVLIGRFMLYVCPSLSAIKPFFSRVPRKIYANLRPQHIKQNLAEYRS